MKVNDIKIIKAGENIRIKSSCTKFGGKYNGKFGIIKKNYWQTDGFYGDVYISLDNQYDENSEYGYFCFHVGDFDVITDTGTIVKNIINNKGEDIVRSEGIINLWRDNQRSAILEVINKKETEILNSDPLYSSVKNHVNEINKLLSENGFSKISDTTKYITFRSYTSSSATEQLKQNEEDKSKLHRDLDKQYIETCAMLSACDTYEQEMEVLKTYKIVGEDGKLVVSCGE